MAISPFLLNPTTMLEMAALIAAFFAFAGRKSGYWALFIPYLLLLLAGEAVGYYFRINKIPNGPLYNFLMLMNLCFFSFLFDRFIGRKSIRAGLFLLLCLFLVFFLIESISRHFASYNQYSRWLMACFILTYCGFFFFGMLKDDALKNPLRHPPFWIITGLFFFYLGSTSMVAFYEQLRQIKLSGEFSFYSLVMACLNFVLYGSWIIAFLWKRKQIQ